MINEQKSPIALVVDDDKNFRFLAQKTLERVNFTVLEAEGGEQALEKFDEQDIDIIILDISMPGMDGFTVCETIRTSEKGSFVPIIMITGVDDFASIRRAFKAGATDFISKPINWLVLSERVKFILRANKEDYKYLQESILNASEDDTIPAVSIEEDESPVFDETIIENLKQLENQLGNSLVNDLFAVYLQDAPSLIKTIKKKYQQEQYESVQQAVVNLKNKSEIIGLLRMIHACQEMEYLLNSSHHEYIPNMIEELSKEYQSTEAQIKERLENNQK